MITAYEVERYFPPDFLKKYQITSYSIARTVRELEYLIIEDAFRDQPQER